MPVQVSDEINRLRIEGPTAREGEQMPGQPGATGDGAAHPIEDPLSLLRR